MAARRDAAPEPRVAESVKDKADRYFAEQCRRLGPVDLEREAEPGETVTRGLHRTLNRVAAKPAHA